MSAGGCLYNASLALALSRGATVPLLTLFTSFNGAVSGSSHTPSNGVASLLCLEKIVEYHAHAYSVHGR